MADAPIPVVLFVYNRADLVRQTVDALLADGVRELIVYSDGPKDDHDRAGVAQVRAIIDAISTAEVERHDRDANHGLGRSVRQGVCEVLSRHDAAIVFEDDLVCVPGTYRFLSGALKRYRDEPRVMSVTAWTHPRVTPAGLGSSPYFDGKAECWAWGTWRRAWKGMERPALDIMKACADAGLDVARYGYDMPIMAEEAARRNLWAIGWWYNHIEQSGLCLRPAHSLVEHTGWDLRGTTTIPKMMENWHSPPVAPIPDLPVQWPEPIEHIDCARLWRQAALDTRLD